MPGHGSCPRIPLKICEICGKEYKPHTFERAKKSRTCSKKCFGILRKTDPKLRQASIDNLPKDVAGQNNPRWKGPITHICIICGKEFEKNRRQGPNHVFKTCSDKCLAILKSQNRTGENNPYWKGGLETIACLNCKQEFEAPPSSNRKFCSLECRDSYWQEDPSRHPNWQGGISKEPYPFEFDENLKEQIRGRDNRQCQLCGVPEDGRYEKHHVHHINYQKHDLRFKNLITLCRSCHNQTHHNRPFWQAFFEAKIKATYSETETSAHYSEQLILF